MSIPVVIKSPFFQPLKVGGSMAKRTTRFPSDSPLLPPQESLSMGIGVAALAPPIQASKAMHLLFSDHSDLFVTSHASQSLMCTGQSKGRLSMNLCVEK
jgi:hypothetical protein